MRIIRFNYIYRLCLDITPQDQRLVAAIDLLDPLLLFQVGQYLIWMNFVNVFIDVIQSFTNSMLVLPFTLWRLGKWISEMTASWVDEGKVLIIHEQ